MLNPENKLYFAINAETPIVMDARELPEIFLQHVSDSQDRVQLTRDEAALFVINQWAEKIVQLEEGSI